MAPPLLNNPANRRKHGRRFAGRLVPDMTPMVGLGFLLVTFFIMAGEFTKTSVMQLSMPMRPIPNDDVSEPMSYKGVVTLILGKNHQVHYYFGENSAYDERPVLYTTNFGPAGLRQVLLKQQKLHPFYNVVLINITADAKYKDMVDVLDEMNITNQRKYALVDIAPEDIELLRLNTL